MENEIAEFRTLLDKVQLGELLHLFVKAVETDKFAEHHARIVKTKSQLCCFCGWVDIRLCQCFLYPYEVYNYLVAIPGFEPGF